MRVSLVADFNGWDPAATPLHTRSNGTRSVDVTLRPGSRVRFRYARPDGTFFEDDEADAFEANGFGQRNSIVCASTPARKGDRPPRRDPEAASGAAILWEPTTRVSVAKRLPGSSDRERPSVSCSRGSRRRCGR